MPAVSICLPTYEPNPDHLRAAVGSVCAQTFSDWELIIHDDASQTDVRAIVEPYLDPPHIRFLRSERRLGIGGNWNAAARFGKGEFVAYIFQDDLWNPEYLDQCVSLLREFPDVGFVAANHQYTMEGMDGAAGIGVYAEVTDLRAREMTDGRIAREPFLQSWIERGLRPNLIGEPSFVVLRRSMMSRAGLFLEDMKQGLDMEYWIRCLLHTDAWWIEESMGSFRVHAAGASARNEENGTGSGDRLRIFRTLIKALPPGKLRTLAKRTLHREVWKMAKKFLKKRILGVSS